MGLLLELERRVKRFKSDCELCVMVLVMDTLDSVRGVRRLPRLSRVRHPPRLTNYARR